MTIRTATLADQLALARLRQSLWPEGPIEEHQCELTHLLAQRTSGPYPCEILIADPGDGELAGFVEVGMRSHADGCDPAQPVGYLEGWYVAPPWRRRGVGSALMAAAEDWARAQGCVEMASDTWISSEESHRAHQALGYDEVDRCVHYRKRL